MSAVTGIERPLGTKFWGEMGAPRRAVSWQLDYPSRGDANRMMVTVPGFKPVRFMVPQAQRQLRTWLDAWDHEWPVIPSRTPLEFRRSENHAALRYLVFGLGAFMCHECLAEPEVRPSLSWDGRSAVVLTTGDCLVIDHKLSRRNRGTNHPENLQPLCEACNSRKASIVDRIVGHILKAMGAR